MLTLLDCRMFLFSSLPLSDFFDHKVLRSFQLHDIKYVTQHVIYDFILEEMTPPHLVIIVCVVGILPGLYLYNVVGDVFASYVGGVVDVVALHGHHFATSSVFDYNFRFHRFRILSRFHFTCLQHQLVLQRFPRNVGVLFLKVVPGV